MKRERERADYMLPYCTANAGAGGEARAQYWQHCRDCDVNVCLACVSICHAGHAMEKGQYGESYWGAMECQCSAQGKCSDKLYRQAALGALVAQAGRHRTELKAQLKAGEDQIRREKTLVSQLEAEVAAYKTADARMRKQTVDRMEAASGKELNAIIQELKDHLVLAPSMKAKEEQLVAARDRHGQVAKLAKDLDALERERGKLLTALEKL
jgi:hypothetical protein